MSNSSSLTSTVEVDHVGSAILDVIVDARGCAQILLGAEQPAEFIFLDHDGQQLIRMAVVPEERVIPIVRPQLAAIRVVTEGSWRAAACGGVAFNVRDTRHEPVCP